MLLELDVVPFKFKLINQYFLFDSHHPLEHILEVIQMLQNQAKKVPSSTNRKQKELTHIEVVFQTCGYSKWTFVNSSERHNKEQPKAESEKRKNVVIPYMAGLSDLIQKNLPKTQTQVKFKLGQTLKQRLVHPKDKTASHKLMCMLFNAKRSALTFI